MEHEQRDGAARAPARPGSRGARVGLALGVAALVASLAAPQLASAISPQPDPAPPPVDPAPQPEGLKGIPVPEPAGIGNYVASRSAAIRLGKALFWDMQLGSDGRTACASCHFSAGADSRSINQLSPGLNRVNSNKSPNPDYTFDFGGTNYQFKPEDFPFHQFENPNDRNSRVIRTSNEVSSSAGIFKSDFHGVSPGMVRDWLSFPGDAVFQKDGLQVRQAEPRNAPTVINSIFNFRNFHDGRATFLFNGVTPFGPADDQARVYKDTGLLFSNVTPVRIALDNASIASLATGPGLSVLEMSAAGRNWPQIGRRLLAAKPLAQQAVSPTDSVLGGVRAADGRGLNGTYESMVQAAFKREWWKGTEQVSISGQSYTQTEANFSMFFGLAIQMYTATLVSDDSPFDRFMAGDGRAMSADASAGMGLFFGKANCAECHGGAEFTNASVRKTLRTPLIRMTMGDGRTAVYDEGFYNTAVQRTLEDIGNGARNDVGRPMALSALAQQVSAAEFERLTGVARNISVSAGERIAVDGAFKTTTIRNVELTAPYFHNGESLTLEQVVEFYNRGGNHFNANIANVDPEIVPLGLNATEVRQLVAFMKATTDERVRFERAPFDHPQLFVTNGHETDASGRVVMEYGVAKDAFIEVPAVGAGGRNAPPLPFLAYASSGNTEQFALSVAHSQQCALAPTGAANGVDVTQGNCATTGSNAGQLWTRVAVANGFSLMHAPTGRCLDVSGASRTAGAALILWDCHGRDNQVFNWTQGSLLQARHSGMCVSVESASTAGGARLVQASCQAGAAHQSFTRQ